MRTTRPTHPSRLARQVAVVAVAVLAASTVAAGAQVVGPARATDHPGARPVVAAGQPEVAAGDSGAAPGGGPAASTSAKDDEEQARRAAQRRRTRAVQQRLATLGWYGGEVDGATGPRTRAAVRGFQRANDLAVDGVAGPNTRAALEASDAVTRAEWQSRRPEPRSAATGGDASTGAGRAGSPTRGSSANAGAGCDLACRGERIVAMTPLQVPAGYTVDVRPGRAGYLGRTDSGSREIVLWVRDSETDRQMAATLLHEIGHAYDFEGLGGRGDDGRRRWADARGFAWNGRDAWFGGGCSSCSDFSVGAGDLAESVHACWAPGWDGFHSQLAGPPTPAQCDLLTQILR